MSCSFGESCREMRRVYTFLFSAVPLLSISPCEDGTTRAYGGHTFQRGVPSTFWKHPFQEPILRTLLRSLLPCQPPTRPFQKLRTLFSEPFLEACLVVRRRSTEQAIDGMVRDTMVNLDRAANGASSSDVFQEMVASGAQGQAFNDGSML